MSGFPAEPSRARPCRSWGSAALSLGWLSHGPATWVGSHLGPCPAAVSTASSGTHPTLRTAETLLSTLGQGGGAGRHGGTVLGVSFGMKAWGEEEGMPKARSGGDMYFGPPNPGMLQEEML